MSRLVYIFAALALAAAALFVWSFYTVEPTTNRVPPTAEAEADPWQAFSRAPGLETRRYTDPNDVVLDEAGLVIVDADAVGAQSAWLWVEWVKRGGRLAVVLEYGQTMPGDWSSDDEVGDLFTTDDRDLESEHAGKARWGNDDPILVDPLVRVAARGDVEYTEGDRRALVVRNVGKGWVAVSGTFYALENAGLREPANRRLAAAFVEGLTAPVWLPAPKQPPPAEPGLGSPVLAVSLLLLAALVFWRAGPRLGPVLETEPLARPGLSERLLAEGRFLRRHKVDLKKEEP